MLPDDVKTKYMNYLPAKKYKAKTAQQKKGVDIH